MPPQPEAVANAVEVLRKRIQQIRERNEIIGEENTKATLIDPLLAALGWDLHDIDEVRREYRRKPQNNPVDYALFLNRTECLFIEAKSLEKDLSDHKWAAQNLSYATAAGVQWCVLTNGDEYRIYNAHAPMPVEEKLFRSVRVSETDPEYVISTLSLLSKEQMRGSLLEEMWNAHFVDRRVQQAIENLLADEDGALVRAIRKKAGALSAAAIRASLKRAKIRIDFPIPPTIRGSTTVKPDEADARKKKLQASRSEAAKKPWETVRFTAEASLENLIGAGLIRPPLQIEQDYKGKHLVGVIRQDGKVEFGGETYHSLSTAGGMARKTVIGSPPDQPFPRTNGWTFWKYRDAATGELRELDFLRKQYLAAKK